MVSGFRRSFSFPTPLSPRSPRAHYGASAAEKSHHRHLRSTSLPCRFHPLVSQLDDEIRSLRSWQFQPAADPEPQIRGIGSGAADPGRAAWIVDGLARLDLLHASLHDLLHLPQSQNLLRHRAAAGWTEKLLDDYLRLADAHGTFRSSVVALRQRQSATQAAIRRCDEPRLASCVRSQRRAEKELVRLASAVRGVGKSPAAAAVLSTEDAAEAELAGIMREVTVLTASVSAAVFLGIATASSATSAPASRWSRFRMAGPLLGRTRNGKEKDEGGEKRRREALQRLEALEESMGALEEKSERVFRRLVNTRVSLLNIL